jgi:uncharacterized DUF497 family protein
MQRKISWDPAKAESNWQKHRVRFEEAETVFHDKLLASMDDVEHSDEEDRFLAIGESRWSPRLLVVVYAIRNDETWLIMARQSTPAERRRYMRGDQIRDKYDDDEPINLEDFPEVDFTNAVRGRHYIPMTITRVSIEDDVARHFNTDEAVNKALRMLIEEGRVPKRDE